MNLKCLWPTLLSVIFLAAGCGKSDPAPGAPAEPTAPPLSHLSGAETVMRIHWLGKERLAALTNAAYQMDLWKLPESIKLETRTLDRLSGAPWLLWNRQPDTNASAQLRPLLNDVLQQECYFEIRQASNHPLQSVFAIRLDDRRAAAWETNLAAVLLSLTGVRPADTAGNVQGWRLKKHHEPDLIELARVGGWIVIGAAQDHNDLFGELVSRVQRGQDPFTAVSNVWLEADLNLSAFLGAGAPGHKQGSDWPRISISLNGSGTNVHTTGQLVFAHLPALELDPWTPPIGIVDGSLASLTAVRGLKPWLASVKPWSDSQIGPPPNQLYFWALTGSQFHTYAAAPLQDASNQVSRFSDLVLQKWDSFFATNDLAKFIRSEEYNGLEWRGAPMLAPALQSLVLRNCNFVFASLFPNLAMSPPPPEFFEHVLGATNLVYFDWELTGQRSDQLLYVGQFARFVSQWAQLPEDSMSLAWIKAMGPKLGESTTRITRIGAGQFSFERTSSIGLTSLELHLLADWLESPRFPIGLHTFLAPGEQTQ